MLNKAEKHCTLDACCVHTICTCALTSSVEWTFGVARCCCVSVLSISPCLCCSLPNYIIKQFSTSPTTVVIWSMVYWKFFVPNDPYNVPDIQGTYKGTCHTYQIFKEHHPEVILCTCSNTFLQPVATFLGNYIHTYIHFIDPSSIQWRLQYETGHKLGKSLRVWTYPAPILNAIYRYITIFLANAAIHKSEGSRNMKCEVTWDKFDVNKRFPIILRSPHHNRFLFVLMFYLILGLYLWPTRRHVGSTWLGVLAWLSPIHSTDILAFLLISQYASEHSELWYCNRTL